MCLIVHKPIRISIQTVNKGGAHLFSEIIAQCNCRTVRNVSCTTFEKVTVYIVSQRLNTRICHRSEGNVAHTTSRQGRALRDWRISRNCMECLYTEFRCFRPAHSAPCHLNSSKPIHPELRRVKHKYVRISVQAAQITPNETAAV